MNCQSQPCSCDECMKEIFVPKIDNRKSYRQAKIDKDPIGFREKERKRVQEYREKWKKQKCKDQSAEPQRRSTGLLREI